MRPPLSIPRSPRTVRRGPARCDGPAGAGFTLVELIVVIVILAVLAGLVVPRTLNVGARQAELEARAAQQLLTVAAERDALSVEPQALEYDDAAGELRLLVRRAGATTTIGRNDAADAWRLDPLFLPVVFTSAKLSQAWADGRPLPRAQWRVVFSQAQARPAMALQIERRTDARSGSSDRTAAWQVVLAPEAPAATRTAVESGQGWAVAAGSRSIDLDAAGKGEKPW